MHLHHHLFPRQLAVPDPEFVVSQSDGRRAVAVSGDGIGWPHPDLGSVRGRAVCQRQLLIDREPVSFREQREDLEGR